MDEANTLRRGDCRLCSRAGDSKRVVQANAELKLALAVVEEAFPQPEWWATKMEWYQWRVAKRVARNVAYKVRLRNTKRCKLGHSYRANGYAFRLKDGIPVLHCNWCRKISRKQERVDLAEMAENAATQREAHKRDEMLVNLAQKMKSAAMLKAAEASHQAQ
jgi:hypothetical protein